MIESGVSLAERREIMQENILKDLAEIFNRYNQEFLAGVSDSVLAEVALDAVEIFCCEVTE